MGDEYKTTSVKMVHVPIVSVVSKTKNEIVQEIIRSKQHESVVETVGNDALHMMSSKELEKKAQDVEKEHELKVDMESAMLLHGNDDEMQGKQQAMKVRGENVGGALGTVMGNLVSSNVDALEEPEVVVEEEEEKNEKKEMMTGATGSGDGGSTGGSTGSSTGEEGGLV